MSKSESASDPFQQTRWTMVLRAAGGGSGARTALEDLCRAYHGPVQKFITAKTGDPQAAEDLTQEYFQDLLRRGYLASARREDGRFRAFLCADVKLYLNNARRRAAAEKRGGTVAHVNLDALESSLEACEEPDAVFDREWALAVFHRALAELRCEYAARDREAVFDLLSPLMDKPGADGIYAVPAAQSGMSVSALKVALSRLRERFAARIRALVSETMHLPEAEAAAADAVLMEEVRYLFRALRETPEGAVNGGNPS